MRGVALDRYLGPHTREMPVIRMGRLGDGVNACTDEGWRAGMAVTASLFDTIGAAITSAANVHTDTATGTRVGDVTAGGVGTAFTGGGAALATGYVAACSPAPGSGATSPAAGSPTNADITALLSATREELANARLDSTTSEAARAREAATASQRTQQYLMIGGGLAVAALVAVLVLRK